MSKKTIKLRVVFMGTSSFADTILEALIAEKYNITSVYTQADKKVGRNQQLQKTAVKITAEKAKIPVFSPAKFGEIEIEELSKQKPDLIIVVAYGKILPQAVLDLPGFGAINIHASLLPQYRGPSPIQNVILDGQKETGVTIMLMDSGIDTGAILGQKKIKIDPEETNLDLSIKLANLSIALILEIVPLWVERKILSQPQDGTKASLCQLIERSDGRIIWTNDAQTIYNQYRAFYSWPGIFAYWYHNELNRRIKINKLSLGKMISAQEHSLGEVFMSEKNVAVQTGMGVVFLEEVQLEGKNNLKINDFINGNPSFVGSVLR
jgi:methionyl-tRNA formyltransferase